MRALPFFLLLIALGLLAGCDNPTVPTGGPGGGHSLAEIQAAWQTDRPSWSGAVWTTAPTLASPYAAGALSAGFADDGLRMLNFCRWLVGLPGDVRIDPGLADQAQHGAVLLAVSTFSHTPPKPADMDQTFYNLAYASTSSSNIAAGFSSIAASIKDGYMRDSDSGNIDRVGHRRWILNPPMAKTGFGYAGQSSTLQAFDASRSPAVDWQTVCWPATGYFPVQFMAGADPWSVTLNPNYWSKPAKASVKVTLRNVDDGLVWNFSAADSNTGGRYFNVETSGYGVSNCIIFRPDGVAAYGAGTTWEATITGLYRKNGSAESLVVRPVFFNLK